MLPFIRSDLAQLIYKPHPNSVTGNQVESSIAVDRLDTNESPFDLPSEFKQSSLGHMSRWLKPTGIRMVGMKHQQAT